jgi:hypothetical protein
MRMSRLFVPAVLALSVVLAGCGKKPAAVVDNTSANAAVLASARLLKAGNMDGLMRTLLPPKDYQQLRQDWNRQRQDADKLSARDRARFAMAMQQLTAPDAQSTLFAQLKPALAKYNSTYKTQMPAMVGIGQTVLDTQIDNSHDLPVEQRTQAKALVSAIGQWVQQVPWGDEAKARQAIGIVVKTARQLDLKTLDQASALDYTAAMKRYGEAWNGLKAVLDVYGLSIDDTLASVSAKTVQSDGNTARVAVHYTVLGKPMKTEVMMIRQDGHWYNRDILANWRRAHAQALKPAVAATTSTAKAAVPATAASAAGTH